MRTIAIALLAGAALSAHAQPDVTFEARTFVNTPGEPADPFDNIEAFNSATTDFLIGNQPTAVAFDGENLYIGGNINGAAARIAIAEISDFFGSAGAKNVPGSEVPAGQVTPGSGYTGMDWSDEFGLVATWDAGSAAGADQVFRFMRDAPDDFSQTLQVSAGGIRGSSGVAYDFGFDGMGFELSDGSMGPAVAVPVFGSGGPFGLDPTTFAPGDDIYGPDNALFNLFVEGTSTLWRDYDIHPDTGLVVGRAANLAILGDRTEFNGTNNLRVITPPGGESPFVVAQNVEIIHNPACGAEMIVLNDRPDSSDLSGTFLSRVLLYDLQGNPMSYEVLLPDGTQAAIPGDSNIYSFFWYEPDQLLFVVDGINRNALALELQCPGEEPCVAADLAEPFGLLDGADVNAFITAFGGGDDAADLNDDGVVDGADVNTFITQFGAGCP